MGTDKRRRKSIQAARRVDAAQTGRTGEPMASVDEECPSAVLLAVMAAVQSHEDNSRRLRQQIVSMEDARVLLACLGHGVPGPMLLVIQQLHRLLMESHIYLAKQICIMADQPSCVVQGRNYPGPYIRDRQTVFWKDTVPNIEDARWCKLFRLPKPIFHSLAASLHEKLVTSPPSGLASIEGRTLGVEKQLAICLNRLGQDGFLAMSSELFGVSETTVHRLLYKVVQAICEVHGDKVQWPTGEARNRVMGSIC